MWNRRTPEKDSLGVAMIRCYFCGEPKGIVMNTRLHPAYARKVEKAHNKVIDMEPCDKCKEWMKKGIILIGVRDDDKEYRTGRFAVVTENAIQEMLEGTPTLERVLQHRVAFIDETTWHAVGLPEGDYNGEA